MRRVTNSDPGVDEHLFLWDTPIIVTRSIAPTRAFVEATCSSGKSAVRRNCVSTDGITGAVHASERHLFLDGSRPQGAVLEAPTLENWVASQLAEEASTLQERRKGRDLLATATVPEKGKDCDVLSGLCRQLLL